MGGPYTDAVAVVSDKRTTTADNGKETTPAVGPS